MKIKKKWVESIVVGALTTVVGALALIGIRKATSKSSGGTRPPSPAPGSPQAPWTQTFALTQGHSYTVNLGYVAPQMRLAMQAANDVRAMLPSATVGSANSGDTTHATVTITWTDPSGSVTVTPPSSINAMVVTDQGTATPATPPAVTPPASPPATPPATPPAPPAWFRQRYSVGPGGPGAGAVRLAIAMTDMLPLLATQNLADWFASNAASFGPVLGRASARSWKFYAPGAPLPADWPTDDPDPAHEYHVEYICASTVGVAAMPPAGKWVAWQLK